MRIHGGFWSTAGTALRRGKTHTFKGVSMKRTQLLAAVLAVAMAGVVASPASTSAAVKTKTVSFKGKYTGTASVLFQGTDIKILSVTGSGSASIVGTSSLSGTGEATGGADSNNCVPFKGKGSLKGASATIKFSVSGSTSKGCSSGQSGPVTVTVTGVAKITGGTSKAKGATGSLKYKGTLKLNDTSGSQTGTFSGTVSGKLTVNK
jgi:hypothetical protein